MGFERLPDIDSRNIILAMESTDNRIFRLWHRDGEAARATLERVKAAWTEPQRRYHGLEHLVDCLREIDLAYVAAADRDLAELALWYHELVYEPFARDSEERSAVTLLTDMAALGVSPVSRETAADLVRMTAHASEEKVDGTPVGDLVLDIDLSILGRDVLRFMEVA